MSTARPLPATLLLVGLLSLLPASGAGAAEEGLASWYGGKFHGRRTASGEIFDSGQLTAAHKSLPFGTLVRVTSLETGRSIIVRINDRGPFVAGRIIDLSRAAATAIGIAGRGVARVRLEILPLQEGVPPAPPPRYTVQLGAFANEEYARQLLAGLRSAGFAPVLERSARGVLRVVIAGVEEPALPDLRRRLGEAGWDDLLVRREP